MSLSKQVEGNGVQTTSSKNMLNLVPYYVYGWALVKNCRDKSRFNKLIFPFLNRILSDLRTICVYMN